MKDVKDATRRVFASGWPTACVLAIALVVLVHRSTFLRVPETSEDELSTIARVRDLIVSEWVEDPGPRRERLRYGAVEGMAAQLDPYSAFIPPEQKERFDADTSGEFGGLGVLIQLDDGHVVVTAPYEDTPAWEAGILPGDKILEIDGKAYKFQTQDEATKRLRGAVGTVVELLVSNPRRPAPVRLALKRAVIKLQSVKGTRIVDPDLAALGTDAPVDPRVGYLHITQFQEPTLGEFDRAIARLTSEGMAALVIDLRGNPGGYLDKACEIASRFLESGKTVVVTRGRGGQNETTKVADAPVAAPKVRVPAAILVDGNTASASEVLAGALRDHRRATLVGMRSFGKGSVQSLFPIDDEKAKLKLTTHYYCTPLGRRIHRVEGATEKDEWGLLPDIPVTLDPKAQQDLQRQEYDLDLEALKAKRGLEFATSIDRSRVQRDPQLDAAVEHLRLVLRNEAKLGPQPQAAPGDVATTDSASAPKGRKRVATPGGGGG